MAILTEALVDMKRTLDALPHGERSAYLKKRAEQAGVSVQTLYRQMREATMKKPRKRRCDAGTSTLTKDEAKYLSALLIETRRANGKQMYTVEQALKVLIANNKVKAERVDKKTGEVKTLSVSAILRALRSYGLHPDQLLRPDPAVQLASKHPNHCWQVDASISAQFYLEKDGIRSVDRAVYYEGKPKNLEKIKDKRLWRYVYTDHASGAIYVEYVLGAESAENLCETFINALQKRGNTDPFHGVPFVLMTDPGAAMTSATFKNLCKALHVNLIINKVGNARAKGQVEQAHNLVEREFESGLKLESATSLEHINENAWRWMRYYNATARHTRTGNTRYNVWMKIKPEELRIAPPKEVCRELAVSKPETRKVTPLLQIPFRGHDYDVSDVPGVLVGEKLEVARNPWRDEDTAQVLFVDEEGKDRYQIIPRVQKDDFGFSVNSATIGESFKSHKETASQKHRQEIEQLVTGTNSEEEAAAARKAKVKPFGGTIDPHKHFREHELPATLDRRGHQLEVHTTPVQEKPLTHVEAAKLLSQKLGNQWQGPQHFTWLKQHHPEGVPREALADIEQKLTAGAAPLRIVK